MSRLVQSSIVITVTFRYLPIGPLSRSQLPADHSMAKAQHNTSPIPNPHDTAHSLSGFRIRHLVASNTIVTRDPGNTDLAKAIEQGCQSIPHASRLTLRLLLCNIHNGHDVIRKNLDPAVEIQDYVSQYGDKFRTPQYSMSKG